MAATEKMLAKRFLTAELRKQLADAVADCGFTLDDVVGSGMQNPDSSIGAYAGDESCYTVFAPLFDQIIAEYHQYPPTGRQQRNLAVSGLDCCNDLDPSTQRILSSRIRVARNVSGFALSPAISEAQRQVLERQIVSALEQLEGDLCGHYYPLQELDEASRTQLIADHFLFKKGDRFLEAAGVNRNWPAARGIFHSADKHFLVWVNEEDHLRIISMQSGGDLRTVFDRLARAIAALENSLSFAYSDHLGYISSCPTNLGTSMRASVHVKLPKLGARGDFQQLCADRRLSVRGVHGEHSKSAGGVWDISNKQRLGLTELDCVQVLHAGVQELLLLEDAE